MIDNGLLKKYFVNRKNKNEEVVLDIFKMGSKSHPILLRDSSSLGVGRYYFKACSKPERDAEVLLSQVYAKAGFSTAIYTPVSFCEEVGYPDESTYYGVISNDVLNNTPVDASELLESGQNTVYEAYMGVNNNEYVGSLLNIRDRYKFFSDFVLCKNLPKDKSDITKHFTKDAARQMIKTRLFDVASFNTDRHTENMFLKLGQNKDVEDILLIDHAFSGTKYEHKVVCQEDINKTSVFCNEFCDGVCDTPKYIVKKTRDIMIDNFKHNESMQEYITPRELAETLGQVDIKGTAEDIRDTIGYEVDKNYTDFLCESFELLAEEVSQA